MLKFDRELGTLTGVNRCEVREEPPLAPVTPVSGHTPAPTLLSSHYCLL